MINPDSVLIISIHLCITAIIIFVIAYKGLSFDYYLWLVFMWPFALIIGTGLSPFVFVWWLGVCLRKRRFFNPIKEIKRAPSGRTTGDCGPS